jgi:hypothetical protein
MQSILLRHNDQPFVYIDDEDDDDNGDDESTNYRMDRMDVETNPKREDFDEESK